MKQIFLKSLFASFIFILWVSLFWFIAYKVYAALSNVSSWNTLTASNYNDLINKINSLESAISTLNSVPSWQISAFNSSTCPTWWSTFSQWTWKFIVWIGSDSQGNTYSLLDNWWEAKHILTIAEMPRHNHDIKSANWSNGTLAQWTTSRQVWNSDSFMNLRVNDDTWWSQSHENRPPYISLLYCIKN